MDILTLRESHFRQADRQAGRQADRPAAAVDGDCICKLQSPI